jgi:hypothetical protein
MLLDELLTRLSELPEQAVQKQSDIAIKRTATMAHLPNPGPQTRAFLCEADELFYGGEAGGGKTDLRHLLRRIKQRRGEDQTGSKKIWAR